MQRHFIAEFWVGLSGVDLYAVSEFGQGAAEFPGVNPLSAAVRIASISEQRYVQGGAVAPSRPRGRCGCEGCQEGTLNLRAFEGEVTGESDGVYLKGAFFSQCQRPWDDHSGRGQEEYGQRACSDCPGCSGTEFDLCEEHRLLAHTGAPKQLP